VYELIEIIKGGHNSNRTEALTLGTQLCWNYAMDEMPVLLELTFCLERLS
jgi:hypothetical protein